MNVLFLLAAVALADPIAFDRAVAEALEASPMARVVAGERDAALGRARTEGAPLANPSVEWERILDEDEVRVAMPLDLAGQPFARAAVGRALADAAEARTERGVAGVGAAAAHAYVDLALAERRAALSERARDLAAEASRAAAALVEAGEIAPVDDLVARADAARLSTQAAGARQDLLAARLTLEVLLGRAPTGDVATTGWPSLADPPPSDPLELPRVRAAEAEARASQAARTLARMELVPTPELVGGWADGGAGGAILGVRVEVPVVAAGAGAVREKAGEYAAATAAAEAARLEATGDAARLASARLAAADAWEAASVPGLDEALDQVAAGWRGGEYSYAEYSARLEALLGAIDAELSARRRLEISKVDLWEFSSQTPRETPP